MVVFTLSPPEAWLPWGLATVIAVPSLPAAFEVFRRYSDDGSVSVVRTFAHSWWRHLRRSLQVGVVAALAIGVLVVDIAWTWGHPVGAVAVPVLATGVVLTAIVALGCLVGLVDRPDATLRGLAKAVVYLMLHRWYLTALSVIAAATLGAVIARQPGLGLGIAAAPLLYLVWANTRHTLDTDPRKAGLNP